MYFRGGYRAIKNTFLVLSFWHPRGKKKYKKESEGGVYFCHSPLPPRLDTFSLLSLFLGKFGKPRDPGSLIHYVAAIQRFLGIVGNPRSIIAPLFNTFRGVQMSDEDPWCLSYCFISGFWGSCFIRFLIHQFPGDFLCFLYDLMQVVP